MKFKTGDIVRDKNNGMVYLINEPHDMYKQHYVCTVLDGGNSVDPPIGTIKWCMPGKDLRLYNTDIYISYLDDDDYLYINVHRNR
jgi:hypothetical protein